MHICEWIWQKGPLVAICWFWASGTEWKHSRWALRCTLLRFNSCSCSRDTLAQSTKICFASDLDIAIAVGTSVTTPLRCVRFVPKACTLDAEECQYVNSRPGFNSNLVSIQALVSIKDSLLWPPVSIWAPTSIRTYMVSKFCTHRDSRSESTECSQSNGQF